MVDGNCVSGIKMSGLIQYWASNIVHYSTLVRVRSILWYYPICNIYIYDGSCCWEYLLQLSIIVALHGSFTMNEYNEYNKSWSMATVETHTTSMLPLPLPSLEMLAIIMKPSSISVESWRIWMARCKIRGGHVSNIHAFIDIETSKWWCCLSPSMIVYVLHTSTKMANVSRWMARSVTMSSIWHIAMTSRWKVGYPRISYIYGIWVSGSLGLWVSWSM